MCACVYMYVYIEMRITMICLRPLFPLEDEIEHGRVAHRGNHGNPAVEVRLLHGIRPRKHV